LHRLDGPAVVDEYGVKAWYDEGRFIRNNLPLRDTVGYIGHVYSGRYRNGRSVEGHIKSEPEPEPKPKPRYFELASKSKSKSKPKPRYIKRDQKR
jgi:hypothetical protein